MVGFVHDLSTSALDTLGQMTVSGELASDTHGFHAALSETPTSSASANTLSFNVAPATTHAGLSESGQEGPVLRSIAQFRPKTPDPDLMSRYADPDHLPPGEQIADGIWRYGNSLFLHGEDNDKIAFDAVRRYAAESGHEGQKVLATIDWADWRTYVWPYKHALGMRDDTHSSRAYWKRSNNPFSNEMHAHVHFGVDQGLIAANGATMPPAGLALHELAHTTNKKYRADLQGVRAGLYTDAEEYRVIASVEHQAQEMHGELPRDSHDGVFYQTDGITSTVPRDPRVGKLFERMKSFQAKLANYLDSWIDKFDPPKPKAPTDLNFTSAAEALGMREKITDEMERQVIELERHPMPDVTPAAV